MGYNAKDVIPYLLAELGCSHPFRISRALLLTDWEMKERFGSGLEGLTYRFFDFGFYIEELPSILSSLKYVEKDEERKCYTYTCEKPKPPKELEALLNEILDRIRGLGNLELNKLIINDRRYKV